MLPAVARRLALHAALAGLAACGPRPAPAAPVAPPPPGAAAGAGAVDEELARALGELLPAEREQARLALGRLSIRLAPRVAALARDGRTADQILAQVQPGAAGAQRGSSDQDGEGDGRGSREKPTAAAALLYQPAEIAPWSPVRGSPLARVTLVVFSDFQCPYCARLEPTLRALEQKYGPDLRIAWRNQPLPFHDRALPAAEAAMAAHAQGHFWEMRDRLLAPGARLDDDSLHRYAAEIGLNLQRFDDELARHVHRDHIEADSRQGLAWGATGTPTVFVNGRRIEGAHPLEAFEEVIDDEKENADSVVAGGVAPAELYPSILAAIRAAIPAPPSADAGDEAAGGGESPRQVSDLKIPADAPSRGPRDAPVVLVEFSDFQCPFCGRALPTLAALEKKYRGKLRRVFMHQPLPFHDQAELAAEASMAAHAEGKFWAMHDALFAHQGELRRDDLLRYGAEVGLSTSRLRKALDQHTFQARVRRDAAEAQRVRVLGTPTFFINGRELAGAQPGEQFEALIERALQSSSAKPAGGPGGKRLR